MRRISRAVSVVGFMAVVALPVTVGAVGTSSAGAAVERHISVLQDGRSVQTITNSMDAGYVNLVANRTEAQGTFVLPSFACTGSQNFDISIQLEGQSVSAVSFVNVTCGGSGAVPTFEGFACAGPSGPCGGTLITPVVGDTITITDTVTASQSASTLDDVTTHQVSSTTGTGSSTTTNSNFIDQRASRTIPTFAKAKFTNCTVNGAPISSGSPIREAMTNGSGITQVKAGLLNSPGTGFTARFEHR